MAPKIVDKKEKKKEILFAVMEVMSQNGIENLKISDIAKYANIGKGTIYEYFKNKDEILESVFEYFFQLIEEGIINKIETASTPLEKLEVFFNLFFDMIFGEYGNFANLTLDIWSYGIRNQKSFTEDLRKKYNSYMKMIEMIIDEGKSNGTFREDFSSEIAARSMIAMGDGLALQIIMAKEDFRDGKVVKGSFDLFIKGLIKDNK